MPYIVIVWDGETWFAGPVPYETEEAARKAARGITLSPVRVVRLGDPLPVQEPDPAEFYRHHRGQTPRPDH